MAVVVAVAAAGCVDCAAEVIYTGEATDEVYAILLDAKGRAERAEDAPTITAPEDGAVIAPDARPTVSWTSPLKLARLEGQTPVDVEGVRREAVAGAEPLRMRRADAVDRLVARLSAWLVPVARAHLPPITSDAYLVEIVAPSRQCPVTIATTALSHRLDGEAWDALVATGGEALTVQVTSAFLVQNVITEGPFAAEPVTFTVSDGAKGAKE